MSMQLTTEQEEQLVSLAKTRGSSPQELLHEVVASFLVSEAHNEASITRSRQQIQDGRVIDHEDLFAGVFANLKT